MSRFADIRTEWRVDSIERKLDQKGESHEISSLRSDVDRLERTNTELSSEIAGLRDELSTLRENITLIAETVTQLGEITEKIM